MGYPELLDPLKWIDSGVECTVTSDTGNDIEL
jgi:hypothetical protein